MRRLENFLKTKPTKTESGRSRKSEQFQEVMKLNW